MTKREIYIGAKVLYHSAITESGKKIGTRETVITSEVKELGSNLVCNVEGVSGCVFITHLEHRN